MARIGPAIKILLIAASRLAFVVVILGIAKRQREQWNDLERRRSLPQPTADALR